MAASALGRLLRTRRFVPFFLTQALGAFNDNVFKQAIILAILFKLNLAEGLWGWQPDTHILVNLCALLFILPFFLFSALGGQLGEKLPKDRLIRALKSFEVTLMLLGAYAVINAHLPLMLAILFAMGMQSALFGPVKYSILPQHLTAQELLAGNAWVELGTFVAILSGTLLAGVLLSLNAYQYWVAGAVLVVALLGLAASWQIPYAAPSAAHIRIDKNIFGQSWRILKLGFAQVRMVRVALLANAWFWFLGTTYLTQIPSYAKDFLGGDESVATLILAVFSVGVAAGSLICERISGGQVKAFPVALGALGLSFCGIVLWWLTGQFIIVPESRWLDVLSSGAGVLILLDIAALGLFGGCYIVPLYALIQSKTPAPERTRVVAANNILNAFLMVLAAVFGMFVLSYLALSVPALFLLVSLIGLGVNAWLFYLEPAFIGLTSKPRP